MNDYLTQQLDGLYGTLGQEEAALLAKSRQRTWAAIQSESQQLFYAYDHMEWPMTGGIWMVVGAAGLVGVHLGHLAEADFLTHYETRLGKSLQRDSAMTDPIKAQLMEYLHGERAAFELPIDWSVLPAFQAQVLRQAMAIPRGEVLTYGGLAQQIGKPKSARAVGRALGTNPMPIIIPCHRIVGANGNLTGYIGGLEMKAYLLRLEGYAA